MAEREWIRVRKGTECPVCGKDSWCSIGREGTHCMRVESLKPLKSGGWFHPSGTQPIEPRRVEPKVRRESDKELHARWAPVARHAWKDQAGACQELAKCLGVAAWALDELCVGWNGSCWTIPERNGYGLIIGISTRRRDGSKLMLPGSRRGLTYSESWADNEGPVLIVEGASDVAAGITLGLATIGRPSNIGGRKYLTRLLGPHRGRRIVVIGERDRKAHADLAEVTRTNHNPHCRGCALCWPGLHGATTTAAELGQVMSRRVSWKMLPHAKDLRQWLNAQGLDVSDQEVCFEAGRRLAKWVG